MAVITMKQLLEAGVHFGHHTRRWNPKMKEYIYGERNGVYIIDLQKTADLIEAAYAKMVEVVRNNNCKVLFVGTRKQIQDIIKEEATGTEIPAPLASVLTKEVRFTDVVKPADMAKVPFEH